MARRVRRGVKARRVVRRFELWSVAKLALVFHLFCWALTVAVLVVLWNVAFRLGTITKLETFLSDFGFSDKVSKQDFRLHGDALFRAGTIAGLGLVAVNTLATVMLAFFYNGVSGLFGGVVVSVLEERAPLSPAERRAAAADGRGQRLALPAGPTEASDAKVSRRERARRERAASAAANAEATAVRMASAPVAADDGSAPTRTPVLPIPKPVANGSRKRKAKAADNPVRVPESSALVPDGVAAVPDGIGSTKPVRPGKAREKPRNGSHRGVLRPKPVVDISSESDDAVGPIARHWASGADEPEVDHGAEGDKVDAVHDPDNPDIPDNDDKAVEPVGTSQTPAN